MSRVSDWGGRAGNLATRALVSASRVALHPFAER